MASSPSLPPPPHACSGSGEASVSLFVDTDLGTRFALLVAGDSTMRNLKSTVAAEHATAFPDIGPVTVQSFQVRRKGELYHLSDTMTIRNAFAKIKSGCFLHVKMTVAVTDTHCCRVTSSMEDRGRSSEGCPGVEVHKDKCALKIPAPISKIANDLPGMENSSIDGMEKKRKRHQPESSSAQVMTKPSTGAMEVPGSIGQVLLHKSNQELQGDDAYNVEMTNRENSGGQGTKHAQVMSDAQETTDLASVRGIDDLVHKEYKDLVTRDMVSSSRVVAGSEKSTQEAHDEAVVETGKMEKASTSKSILEKIQSDGHTSQGKRKKKAKKVNSVDTGSLDIAGEKDQGEHRKNSAKSDKFITQGKIVNDPLDQQISRNVQPEGSNPCDDGRRKKKRKHRSEPSKNTDPTHDVTKSSGLITNEITMQNTDAYPLDPEQLTSATTGEGAVSHQKKFDVSLDVAAAAAANVIDEVLADLRSTDITSKNLDEYKLTEQIHPDRYHNALGVHGNNVGKGGPSAVLPPKYPAAIHSDVPTSSPDYSKAKGKQLKVLPVVHDSLMSSGGIPEENANTELREPVSLRSSDNTSDSHNISTENVVVQGDDKTKATKRQRKKISLKHAPTDNCKTIQSLDEQVNQVATENLNGVNATKADLVQGGSVIDGSAGTVENVKKKIRSSKICKPEIQQDNHSTHAEDSKSAKGSQDNSVSYIGESGTLSNVTAVGAPTQSPAVQEEATALKTSTPNVRKGRKRSSKIELQSQNSALDCGSDVDLMNYKAERITVSPKKSAIAAEPNENINFLDRFSPSVTNDPYISAENKESNEDETVREVEDRSNKRKPDTQSQRAGNAKSNDLLESHLPGDMGVPSDSTENIDMTDGNVKKGKGKKRNRKSDLLNSVSPQADPNGDHREIDNGIHDLSFSVVQEGRMEHDKNENSNNVIQKSSMQQDPKDAMCDSSLGKKPNQSKIDSNNQGKLPVGKDHAWMDKEQCKSSSQTKPHNGRVDPNSKSIRNLVKSFSMSPPASSDSMHGTPQNVRLRVAVRKVPRKRYEQTDGKSKKDKSTGTIFSDAISDGSDDELHTMSQKVAMETSSDDSSTSADSGISSAAHDESGDSDDDGNGNAPLSQKSLKGISSILRGSSSYKKARQRQTEQLDDTEVPDSQPVDF
uniref:Uncharacterized protein n=1 Tax=Leersia perrieri TaxID=77586 RepID=A0A0D9W6C9_9ORYZ